MDSLKELLIPTLVSASVVTLIALAFHLTLRAAADVADFAVGQYAVIGGLICGWVSLDRGLPMLMGIALGVGVAALISLISDWAVFQRIERTWGKHEGTLSAVMASVALLWIWEQAAILVFGDYARRSPAVVNAEFDLLGVRANGQQLVIIGVTVLVLVGTYLLLRYTRLGRSLKATGDDRTAAEALGLSVRRARVFAFLLAGGVAGIAGVLAAPLAGLRPSGGTVFTLEGFVALFLGGASSLAGAPVGALLLEGIKFATGRYVGIAWQDYVLLLVALSVFAFRPSGIVGGRHG